MPLEGVAPLLRGWLGVTTKHELPGLVTRCVAGAMACETAEVPLAMPRKLA